MCNKKVNKAYVSDMDIFLHTLDQKFANTQPQDAEIAKHERIFHLRDNAACEKGDHPTLWEDF